MAEKKLYIVQASSSTWAGGKDFQMNKVENRIVTSHTIQKIYCNEIDPKVIVAAPEYDRNGLLEILRHEFDNYDFEIFYGSLDNPLERILSSTKNLSNFKYISRVDGIHMFFDIETLKKMYNDAIEFDYDLVMFPHDYPKHFTAEVYSLNSLEKVSKLIDTGEYPKRHSIHPKYIMCNSDAFKTKIIDYPNSFSDAELRTKREVAKNIYNHERLYVKKDKSIAHADQISFHYVLAKDFILGDSVVLDIACGDGTGTYSLSDSVKEIIGADIDNELIAKLETNNKSANVIFKHEDALNLSFSDESFDVVCSMETIEHIPPTDFLNEVFRVLKTGGVFILSTPQNSLGNIPINAEHSIEFSLSEIKNLVGQHFEIKKIIGLKAGTIYFDDDPIGANTFLVCQKR